MSTPTTTTSDLPPRVLMICDDRQIDRRILQEAETLAKQGSSVLVLGRSGDQLPRGECHGQVSIERIDAASVERAEALRSEIRLSLDRAPIPDDPPLQMAEAVREFANLIRTSHYLVPEFPRWVERQGRVARVIGKALLWPPLRLDLLRRFFPRLPVALAYLLYVPTLLLTPRPAAFRWHWVGLKKNIAAWLPSPYGEKLLQELQSDTDAQVHVLAQRVSRFLDLNDWELALFERGCAYAPEIVHVHDLPQLRAGCFIARKLGISVIYDAHELYPVIHTLSAEQQQRLRVIERRFIRQVDHCITVNPFIAARMAEDYAIATPTVLLNAAEPYSLVNGQRPEKLREVLGLTAMHQILLFQGWISLERRIGDLVRAMVEVPDSIHLVLLGYGEDIGKLRRIVAELKLATRVHFLETVPQEELMHWVASADAGVIPYQPVDDNHLYCSPNKLFEFIAANVPIIANDLPYLRSVVAANSFGVVREFVALRDYAVAIREMFDPALGGPDRFRGAMQSGATPYLWPEQARVLLDVYAEVWSDRANRTAASGGLAVSVVRNSSDVTATITDDRPLRVFHGMHNIAGIASILARAERKFGLESQAVCFPKAKFGYVADIEEMQVTQRSVLTQRFERHADQFDVFVFHFGSSLSNEALVDIPILKRLGKTVIFYFHGCDIRDSAETIRKYEFSACKVCRPRRCNINRDLALEMATRYADAIWVSTPDLLEFVPGAELFLQPVETERFPYRARTNRPDTAPMLVHAPSNSLLKGTRHVIAAVEDINASGTALQLLLLQGMPHEEVKARLAGADFAVDQLLIGSYGLFSVEAMANRTPVICYLREDLLECYPERPPIFIANPRTLRKTLVDMMQDRDKCQNMASAARAYIERHHDAEVLARRSRATYERLRGVGMRKTEPELIEPRYA